MRPIAGIILLAAVCSATSAQQPKGPKPQTPRGTVTGSIYCADTNAPARLARVSLIPISRQPNGQLFITQSDLEGRFSVGRVTEGTYYVSVQYGGYLDTFPDIWASDLARMRTEERKQIEARAITVSVTAQQTSSVSVRLERAAVLEGTVLYDDGSPAVGLSITIRPKPGPRSDSGAKKPTEDDPYTVISALNDALQRITDDRGHYRAVGLAPGDYLVSTMLSTASGAAPAINASAESVRYSAAAGVTVYYGDATRASEAKTVKITGGEALSGTDITIPLSKLHSVRGQVVQKSTGQPPWSASLRLLYADTREPARVALSPNGEIDLSYVPEGSYVLQAMVSTQPPSSSDGDETGVVMTGGGGFFAAVGDLMSSQLESDFALKFQQYAAAEIPLDVHGEVTGIVIEAPDQLAPKTNTASASASVPTVIAEPPQ